MFCILFGRWGKGYQAKALFTNTPIWPAPPRPFSLLGKCHSSQVTEVKNKNKKKPLGLIVIPFPHARVPWLKIQRSGPRGCKQSETRKLGKKTTLEEKHHFWAILGDLHCHLKPGLCLGSCWGMLTPYSWCSFHVEGLLLRQHSWPFHTLLLIPPRRG